MRASEVATWQGRLAETTEGMDLLALWSMGPPRQSPCRWHSETKQRVTRAAAPITRCLVLWGQVFNLSGQTDRLKTCPHMHGLLLIHHRQLHRRGGRAVGGGVVLVGHRLGRLGLDWVL